jgi:integral membrane protein
MRSKAIRRLRTIGLMEGTSFLLLLGVAMPLKYFADLPLAVSVVGWIHGVLFVLFCYLLVLAHQDAKWPLSKSALVLLAGLLPFGPFLVDRRLQAEQGADQ